MTPLEDFAQIRVAVGHGRFAGKGEQARDDLAAAGQFLAHQGGKLAQLRQVGRCQRVSGHRRLDQVT